MTQPGVEKVDSVIQQLMGTSRPDVTTGTWTDFVYANGQKIAKADSTVKYYLWTALAPRSSN